MDALTHILLHRKECAARETYRTHLIWLMSAQLYALCGGKDYPVPSVFDLFPADDQPQDRRSAADIRQSILHRLRKETDHG